MLLVDANYRALDRIGTHRIAAGSETCFLAGDISCRRGETDVGICHIKKTNQLTARVFEWNRMRFTVQAKRDYCEVLDKLWSRFGDEAVHRAQKDQTLMCS